MLQVAVPLPTYLVQFNPTVISKYRKVQVLNTALKVLNLVLVDPRFARYASVPDHVAHYFLNTPTS